MKHESSIKPACAHILDTSAIIAYLAEEPGASKVQSVKPTAALPFIVLTELYYVAWRQQGEALAEEVIQHALGWHLPVLVADERLSISAGQLKARYKLGVADSYIAAFALMHQATLVTKDSDFRILEPRLKLLFL